MVDWMSYDTLQVYWWSIISLLAGLLVFMMFIQGGQTLFSRLGKSESEKQLLINALGRKWELGFTTLVLFGGAIFASFPLFYSVSFGGAYWVWMAILFSFIIQAVSYEYRSKPNNLLGKKGYEYFLLLNGYGGVFLVGVAVSTLISGANFTLDAHHFMHWQHPLRGLEALGVGANYLLGFALLFLVRITGAMYFINHIDEAVLQQRARKSIAYDALLFLLFFLPFLGWLFLHDGYGYDAQTHAVFNEPFKYLHNAIALPLVSVMLLSGIALILYALIDALLKKGRKSIWFQGVGVVFSVTALFLLLGLNHTMFYPSLADMDSSLSIANASGSHFTLRVMAYVSLMVPFVVGYIAYVWYKMDRVKLTHHQMQHSDTHWY